MDKQRSRSNARSQTNEALREALEESKRRQAEVSALLEGSHAILEHRRFEDSARSIFQACKNLIGATAGYVALLSDDGSENRVLFLDSGGMPCTVDPGLPMPIRGLRAEAYRSGETVFRNGFPESEFVRWLPEGHVGLDNVLFAPLVISEKVIGLLGIANKPGGFIEEDARMASAFGKLAAIALHNSQTFDALEESKKELTRLASFPELNPNPVVEVDLSGKVYYLNPAAKLLLPDLQAFGCHQGWLANLEPLAEQFKYGPNQSHAREVRIGDVWYEQNIHWVPENGHIRIYGYNISDRKWMEEEISRAYDGLERRVQERTEDLTRVNEQLEIKISELKQAQDALFEQSRILETFFTSTVTPLVFLDRNFNFIRVNDAYARVCRRKASDFPGRNHFDLYPSDAKAIFEQVVETQVPYQAVARPFTFPDRPEWGTTYWDWTLTPIVDQAGEVEFLVFSLNDVTDRKENENRIRSTNALLQLFSKKSDKRDYFQAVIDLLQTWSQCRCVGIRVLHDRQSIPYEAYTGFSREFWESENGLMIRHDSCVCTRVATGNPYPDEKAMMTAMGSFRCDDAFHFFHGLSAEGQKNYRGKCIHYGFTSVAVIPIRYQDQVLGVIHLADERRGRVPFRVVEFIEAMAPLIGEATNRFQLETEIRESENRLRHLSSQLLSIQEKERKRVAQEIHDGIGQMLTALKFKIESSLGSSGKTGKKEHPLEGVIPMIQGSIEEVRRIQMDLRPSTLDDLGFLATLAWFTREFEKIYSSIHIEKQIDVKEQEIPPVLKTVFFRIMQEAMNNISKHSRAETVRLSLQKKDHTIELMIQDNGVGFNPKQALDPEGSRRGFGLSSMRERAEFSGGSLTIQSAEGKGTTILAQWPLP